MGKRIIHRGIICFILLLSHIIVVAQTIQAKKAIDVGISYDKTLHFIFSTSIRYFDVGNSDKVAVDKPDNVKNVLRVKAQERNFIGNTNLSVVTADGAFHSYMLSYNDDPKYSYIREDNKYIQPQMIKVCNDKSTHLIFPDKIKYVDFGDNTIAVEKAEKVDNIIRIHAEEDKTFPETNVSVITDDDKFYTVDINYSKIPSCYSYVIADTVANKLRSNEVAIFNDVEINSKEQDKICSNILKSKRNIYNLAAKAGNVTLAVWNIYVNSNTLLMKLEMNNRSSINYDIDFIKFYITDRKLMKKTAVQETIIEPLFQNGYSDTVTGKSKMDWVVGFDKFTIPEGRKFVVEIQEKNGGRHFKFTVPASPVLDAVDLPKEIINK